MTFLQAFRRKLTVITVGCTLVRLTTPKASLTANLKGGYEAIVVLMKSFPIVLCFAAFYFPSFCKVGKTVCCSHQFFAFLCCKPLYLHNPSGAEQAGDVSPCSPASPAAVPKQFEGNVRAIGGGLAQAC